MSHFKRTAVAALALLCPLVARAQAPPPIDPKVEARAEALLKQMTLEEKLGQLSQIFWYKGLKDDQIVKGQVGS